MFFINVHLGLNIHTYNHVTRSIYNYTGMISLQSEHIAIGQLATPHNRRSGGIGRVVPIESHWTAFTDNSHHSVAFSRLGLNTLLALYYFTGPVA